MMECQLSNAISYTAFPVMIRTQRHAVDEKLKQYSTSHTSYAPACTMCEGAGARQRRTTAVGSSTRAPPHISGALVVSEHDSMG
jgi:hypothetical protein